MKNGKRVLKYELYISASAKKVWGALTEGEATKQYFYGCAVRSTFKQGALISYLGDGEFNMLDGEVLEVKTGERLLTTFRAQWDGKVVKDKPSRLLWELTPMGKATKLTLVHDGFAHETATYEQSESGWPLILSSLKTYVETGKPLVLEQNA
jgi:uncharacterized protein YndB with AHSA1/START domain